MQHAAMDDGGEDKNDSKRKTRNLSEKKRRDQFNKLVHELSTMVSFKGRKMDKSTILKSTISFLKNHNEIKLRSRTNDVQEEWKPAFLSNEEFTYLVLEALEGFVMVFSSTGNICYVSESITSILGQTPANVVNKSIFNFISEEDRPALYNLLQRSALTTEQANTDLKDNVIVSFKLHLKRGGLDIEDETVYDLVTFNGHFRTNFQHPNGDHDKYQQDTESSVLFIGTGRLHTPQLIRDVSLLDPNRAEFSSRHSLEWKFLFLDHRAPPIIGYMPFEVLGTSGYDYYHFDDLEKIVTCHEELKKKGELVSCYYRFLTKGQQWIWLQTRYYITYHQWSSKPEFVMCTHLVISQEDILKSAKEECTTEAANESDINGSVKQTPTEDAALSMSPSYTSEVSDAFNNSFLTNSSVDYRVAQETPSDDVTLPPMSPSYMSEASDVFASSYLSHPQVSSKKRRINRGHSENTGMVSPSHMSEASENYTTYTTRAPSQSVSMKSGQSNLGTWARGRRYVNDSDTCSVSGDSHSSARHCSLELPLLSPQHAIGAQFLEPVPYVNVTAVGVPAVLPLPLCHVPVIMPQTQAQIQEQLQRKHEELQHMIVRQQAELQKVKEQLLLARLGILQPVINVPYSNPEQLQQQMSIAQPLAQITYEPPLSVPSTSEYPEPNPSPPSHSSRAPSLDHHQQMPPK